MSTSDAGAGAPTAGEGGDFPLKLGAEIARLANELFGRPPLPPVTAAGSPGVVVPPNPGPSAAAPGAGGVSTQHTLPPIPGPAIAPPIAQAPAPRDSDLRLIPSQVGE